MCMHLLSSPVFAFPRHASGQLTVPCKRPTYNDMQAASLQVGDRHYALFDKAESFWRTQAGGKLNPPGPESLDLIPELIPVDVRSHSPCMRELLLSKHVCFC
jgi:hypothetical protein